ncbi:MAG: N-acetyl-alpha-D-glucosaminyl L-malate synthase [Syntrophomonadaceae bacterium]|nr:N-acetyl-alpha-D-glucosaminyl L-malate synthase [Bacillota bacterium]
MKMKILFVTPRFPYPPLKGDQVVPYHRLRILSQRHEITLFSLYEKEDELAGLDNLKPFCKAIHTVRLPQWRSVMNVALKGPFTSLPLQALYYWFNAFKKRIDELLAENSFDLIHAYMLRVAPYLSDVSAPKVLELIDSMQLNLERRVAMERIPKRWLFQEELRRIVHYERNIGDYFDQMIVVSEKDRALIPNKKVRVIPNGVDTELFKPQSKESKEPAIVFSGNMGYFPNESAVIWFVEKCFRRIKKEIPDAKLVIAGNNPSSKIKKLGDNLSIFVTGFVESMVDELNKAQVAIAPMQSGSGMQFKILEAMSCNLPVVTTTLGLGDIKARPGEEICVADTAEDFAETVVTLIKSPEMADRIGRKAREFVMHNHSWENAASQVEEIYSRLLKE